MIPRRSVGGETLEATLEMMNDLGRIIACGAISQYDTPPEKRYGVKNIFHVVAKRITIHGFIVSGDQFSEEDKAAADKMLADRLADGSLVDRFNQVEGFASLPGALIGLLRGQNTGKMMVKVEPSPGSESTRISPPCDPTMFITIARPRPVPSNSRFAAPATCRKASKMLAC